MELLKNLFEGYPDLWGGGVAHSVLILSLVIAFGIMVAKIKVAGVSLGITRIPTIVVMGVPVTNCNIIVMTTPRKTTSIANRFKVSPPFLKAEKKPGPTCSPME